MSTEIRTRVRCDICGELINGKYFKCEQATAESSDGYVVHDFGLTYVDAGGWHSAPPRFDVCTDCWERLLPQHPGIAPEDQVDE